MRKLILSCLVMILIFLCAPRQISLAQDAEKTPTPLPYDKLTVIDVQTLDITAKQAYLSPDGERIALIKEPSLCVYEIKTAHELCPDSQQTNPRTVSPASIKWSPDSTKVAFTENFIGFFDEPDVWIMDALNGNLTDLTDDNVVGMSQKQGASDFDLTLDWLPDGKSITFVRCAKGDPTCDSTKLENIVVATGKVVDIGTIGQLPGVSMDISPDGNHLAYVDGVMYRLWLADLDGKNMSQAPETNHGSVSFSADSQYVLSYLDSPTSTLSFSRIVEVSTAKLVLNHPQMRLLGWSPSGSGLAYKGKDEGGQNAGLYITDSPINEGHLVYKSPTLDSTAVNYGLQWAANNKLLVKDKSRFALIQLGIK